MLLRVLIACVFSLGSFQLLHAQSKPLKVFVLVGQSNMQGHAQVRTLEHLLLDPNSSPLREELLDEQGKPLTAKDVWISSLSTAGEKVGKLTVGFGATEEKLGPEYAFGITVQELVGEPVLIIKTAWGGKSLHTDFRPPSAGPYKFPEEQLKRFESQGKDVQQIERQKVEATGVYYRKMVEHVTSVLDDIKRVVPGYDPAQGYELAGLVWFQGWNDMVDRGTYPKRDQPGGYAQYSKLLEQFIRDVRRDLNAPELPFVIGVLGVGGPLEKQPPESRRYHPVHRNFRAAMEAPVSKPEFEDSVFAVRTEEYWDLELSAIKARQNKVQQEVKRKAKEDQLSREEVRDLLEAELQRLLTQEERAILEKGASNAEYHYLGSAKILSGIGRAFALALEPTFEKP